MSTTESQESMKHTAAIGQEVGSGASTVAKVARGRDAWLWSPAASSTHIKKHSQQPITRRQWQRLCSDADPRKSLC